jgi:hyperosmotically inducible periplasmic protein
MKRTVLGQALMAVVLLAGAGVAGATDKNKTGDVPQGDDAVAKSVRHEVLGAVTEPWKKSDIEKIVQKAPGVTSVADQIKVLPLSDFDKRLRIQIARSIYGDPVFLQYRNMALPPIHIVVENGHVTLTGWVNNDLEKQVAGMRANTSMSFGTVVNNLQVEHPAAKKS